MTRYALWQQLATFPAQLDRQMIARLWPPSRLGGMAVKLATGRDVTIDPGAFGVPLGAGQGSALCISDAVETVTFPAPPAAGFWRWDFLVVQVRDQAIDQGNQNGFTFDVVQGVAVNNPGAGAPLIPPMAGVLAQIYAIGGQANIAPADLYPGYGERLLQAKLAADIPMPTPNQGYSIFNVVLREGLWHCEGMANISASNATDPYHAAVAYFEASGGSGFTVVAENSAADVRSNAPTQSQFPLRPWMWVDVAPGGACSLELRTIPQSPAGGIVKAVGLYGLSVTGYVCHRVGPSMAG